MNWRPILTVLARLLAFVVVAEAMTIWEFWRSSWTPIELVPPCVHLVLTADRLSIHGRSPVDIEDRTASESAARQG